jgi:hypothetical protein
VINHCLQGDEMLTVVKDPTDVPYDIEATVSTSSYFVNIRFHPILIRHIWEHNKPENMVTL